MKSIEEKLASFEKSVIHSAVRERDHYSQELERRKTAELKEAKNRYRQEVRVSYSKGLEEVQKEARFIVSTAKNEGQTALAQKRNAIIDLVFSELTEKLRAFVRSAAYENYFTKKLKEALAAAAVVYQNGGAGKTIRVLLTAADASDKEKLVRAVSADILPGAAIHIESCEEDILGGCCLVLPEAGRAIDNSLLSAVKRERDTFLSWSKLSSI